MNKGTAEKVKHMNKETADQEAAEQENKNGSATPTSSTLIKRFPSSLFCMWFAFSAVSSFCLLGDLLLVQWFPCSFYFTCDRLNVYLLP